MAKQPRSNSHDIILSGRHHKAGKCFLTFANLCLGLRNLASVRAETTLSRVLLGS